MFLCPTGSGGNTSPGGRKGREGGEGEEGAGPGTKPHLRVKIPGQKGFVPRTVSSAHFFSFFISCMCSRCAQMLILESFACKKI